MTDDRAKQSEGEVGRQVCSCLVIDNPNSRFITFHRCPWKAAMVFNGKHYCRVHAPDGAKESNIRQEGV